MEQQQNAKFAFYYLLSLVALIFMALSTGMIIFQTINKYIVDILDQFAGQYLSDVLKFAISAIVISAPIFYVLLWQIHKSLFSGALDKESGIRKWLTYFILLISSIVMIGWLIATINSFLNGDLSTKFILKSITAILISAAIFTFYFYDIKRKDVLGKKDNIIRAYFYASLAVVVVVFITSLFIVDSPTETRNRKFDILILDNFNAIDSAINQYYIDKKKLPDTLDDLKADYSFITDETLKNKATGVRFDYKKPEANKYELCATFLTNNVDIKDVSFYGYKESWPHESGYQCLSQKVLQPDAMKAMEAEKALP